MNGTWTRRMQELVLEGVGPHRNYCICQDGSCRFCRAWDRAYRRVTFERERDACAQIVIDLRAEVVRIAGEMGQGDAPQTEAACQLLDEAGRSHPREDLTMSVHARLVDPVGGVVLACDVGLKRPPGIGADKKWTRDPSGVTCRACRARLARHPQLRNLMVQEAEVEDFADRMAEIAEADRG